MTEQKVLVTGASGFVGQALCEYLLKKDFDVIGCGRQNTVSISHPNFQYEVCDLTDLPRLNQLVSQVNHIVHSAAIAHQGEMLDPDMYFKINTEGTKNLLALACQQKIKRFIYLSTIKVHGEGKSNYAYQETDPPELNDPYASSKWWAEVAVRTCEDPALEWVIVRPPLVYGKGPKANLANLIKLVDLKLPLPFKTIRNKRSFIAIDNLCDFIVTTLTHSRAPRQIFCVSDGDDQSTPDLVSALQEVRLKKTALFSVPQTWFKVLATLIGKRGAYDRLMGSLQVNNTKARDLLNWQPPLRFKEAVAAYFTERR